VSALDCQKEDFISEDVENLEEPELYGILIGLGLWGATLISYIVLVRLNWIAGL